MLNLLRRPSIMQNLMYVDVDKGVLLAFTDSNCDGGMGCWTIHPFFREGGGAGQ